MNRREADNSKLSRAADSAVMKLLAQSSALIIVGLSVWILSGVADLKTGFAVITDHVAAHDRRIDSLEAWRNHTAGAGL